MEEKLEHENVFALMMDTLDGEISTTNRTTLEVHLHACPECRREWQALLAIDTLFRQTPAMSPAADFAQRTLARLPNRRVRRAAISGIYGALLLSGIIPLVLVSWLIVRFGPILTQPALVESVTNSLNSTTQVGRTIFFALLNSAGEVVIQQPTIIGWLLVMIGIVFVWGGVYQRLLGQPQPLLTRTNANS